jgi:hypothetical protein
MIAARPSVINVCCSFFTLVAAPRQPQTRNGFPSGGIGNNCHRSAIPRPLRFALSTESGLALTLAIKCECTSSADVRGPRCVPLAAVVHVTRRLFFLSHFG